MARARNIKPGFFTNDHLAEIQPLGRLLFAGLWTIADREGRLEDRPKRIKAEVLPYDKCNVDALLGQLECAGFIRRYAAEGHQYIQVLNFGKHQNPHVREPESVIPAPDEHSAGPVLAPDENVPSPADTGFPITDSPLLIPDTPTQQARTREASPSEPFEALVALCHATGADIGELSGSVKSKQLGKAKQLLGDGMSLWDIGRLAGYCASQSWRTSPVDMFTLEKERGKWELAGKPASEPTKAARASPFAGIDEFEQRVNGTHEAGPEYVEATWRST